MDVQVDEPDERVLVHGLDVRQVGDAEEQDGRMDGDRSVAVARRVDLGLGARRHLLLRRDVLRQRLRRRQHVDRLLVFQYVALHDSARSSLIIPPTNSLLVLLVGCWISCSYFRTLLLAWSLEPENSTASHL